MKTTLTPLFALLMGASAMAQTVSDFENVELAPGSYYNGSDGSDGTASGNAFFPTEYIVDWSFWSGGFAVSNVTDAVTPGFGNMYASRAGSGYDGSANYAVGQDGAIVRLTGSAVSVAGAYITNTTYAARSMEFGDAFAKQFGSPLNAAGVEDGTDGADWFLMRVEGFLGGNQVAASVDFYLADFRFEDDADDYIVTDWQWVDLSPLGPVDSIRFSLSSSDVGTFGMNTPAFFSIDHLETVDDEAVAVAEASASRMTVFPNPAADFIRVSDAEGASLRILDLSGRELMQHTSPQSVANMSVSHLPAGAYLLEAIGMKGREVLKFLIQ